MGKAEREGIKGWRGKRTGNVTQTVCEKYAYRRHVYECSEGRRQRRALVFRAVAIVEVSGELLKGRGSS